MTRDTLTEDQIVQTAIELLDAEGLEGLSMRALGARLDSAATAVYWHIENKDHLVVLAGDRVWNEIELPDLDVVDWRRAATAMARSLHAMLTRHPWLLQAFSSGSHILYGPGKARYTDHSIAVYEQAGFVGEEADQATAAVFMFVLGSALGESASIGLKRRLSRDGGDAEARIRDTVERASEIALRFPRLRARLEAGTAVDYAAAPEQSFEYGLQVILAGLEAQLAARRPATGRGAP